MDWAEHIGGLYQLDDQLKLAFQATEPGIADAAEQYAPLNQSVRTVMMAMQRLCNEQLSRSDHAVAAGRARAARRAGRPVRGDQGQARELGS